MLIARNIITQISAYDESKFIAVAVAIVCVVVDFLLNSLCFYSLLCYTRTIPAQ